VERRELYILRRYFGINAYDAEHVLPAWERQLLLEEYVAESQEQSKTSRSVPVQAPDFDPDAPEPPVPQELLRLPIEG
jgi:hypothetical protein